MPKEVILQTLKGRTTTDPGVWTTWTRYDSRDNAIARGYLLQTRAEEEGLPHLHWRVKPVVDESPCPGGIPGCLCGPMNGDPLPPPRVQHARPKAKSVMDKALEADAAKKRECSMCLGLLCDPGGTDGACLL